jgi:hypothetical protein
VSLRRELLAERMSREAVERDERRARRALTRWGNPRAKRQLSPAEYVDFVMARNVECDRTRIRRPTSSIASVRRARTPRRRATIRRRAVRSTADPPPPPPPLAPRSLGASPAPGDPPAGSRRPRLRGASSAGCVAAGCRQARPRAPLAAGGVDRPGGRGVSPEAPKGPRGEGAAGPLVRGGTRGGRRPPRCGPRSGRPWKREEISVPHWDCSGFLSSAVAGLAEARRG